ncbi:NAD(P)H-hydrate dehydratase [Candidatus Providencia siddallii]|uniref:ADP-dependent (S)-NAD(P)H-hydrate dehydratase n=1 Tax=Candidatus Providencia siddallii TaxID=1715285 RepID=A0ABM9NPL1_9GAMM
MKRIDLNSINKYYHFLKKLRLEDSHKGMFGTLGLIGGSYGMIGAIILAGCSALKIGCGKVIIGFNQLKCAVSLIESMPELILRTVNEIINDISLTNLVVGPGLGINPVSSILIKMIVLDKKKYILLDADALNILSITSDIKLHENCIITPHPKEAACLLHTNVKKIQFNRKKSILMLSKQYCCWVVLKGYHTLISSPDGDLWCNYSGNNGLSTAGTGDVLSGIIGGLLAQKIPIQEAICGGVWIHGAAADRAVLEGIGPIGLTAHEIIDYARIIRNKLAKNYFFKKLNKKVIR